MSKPTPGKQYTVIEGDTLENIALQAYGDKNLWRIISQANQTTLRSGDPNLIFPGEIILIPVIADENQRRTTLASSQLQNKAKDELTITANGNEIRVTAARLIRTMDTAADGWTCVVPWEPGVDNILDEIVKPLAYPTGACYIGSELLISGLFYGVEPTLNTDGRVVNMEGFSYTKDIIDSTLKPPYEKNKITLLQRAKDQVEHKGIKVIVDDGINTGGVFDRVTAEPTDKIFEHLSKLAAQRSVLISSTPEGNLLFTATKSGPPVGTIEENLPLGQEFKAKFDGTKLFNTYRAIGQSPGNNAKNAVASDNNIPLSRSLTFKADDTTDGDITKAAAWRRTKQLAEALSIPFPVSSWFAPNGKLWRENTFVTVVSPTLSLPDGFTFLIRRVEYVFSAQGKNAVLSLVPPQVYTGEEINNPWG